MSNYDSTNSPKAPASKSSVDKMSIYQGAAKKFRWFPKIQGAKVVEIGGEGSLGLFSRNILFWDACRFHTFGHECKSPWLGMGLNFGKMKPRCPRSFKNRCWAPKLFL